MDRPEWETVKEYQDVSHHTSDGVARIAFNRPEVRNAYAEKRKPDFRNYSWLP